MTIFGKIINALCFASVSIWPHTTLADAPKPLSDYRTASRIWLTMADGLIQPANLEKFRSKSEEEIIFLKPNGAQLLKGETWAILNPEQLDLNLRELEIERKLHKKALNDAELNSSEEVERLQTELEKLATQRREILAGLETPGIPKNLQKRVRNALTKIDKKVERITTKLTPDTIQENLHLAQEELNLKLAKQERAFTKLKERSTLKAKHPGTLNILLEATTDSQAKDIPLKIPTNTLYATITDETHYNLLISNRNPAFSKYDNNKLTALIDDGVSQGLLETTYLEKRKIDVGSQLKDHHFFRFAEKDNKFASQNVDEKRSLYIYLNLDKPCHIVRKRDIALLKPNILKEHGWKGLIRHLYPGAKVTHNGPKNLAIEAPNGN